MIGARLFGQLPGRSTEFGATGRRRRRRVGHRLGLVLVAKLWLADATVAATYPIAADRPDARRRAIKLFESKVTASDSVRLVGDVFKLVSYLAPPACKQLDFGAA